MNGLKGRWLQSRSGDIQKFREEVGLTPLRILILSGSNRTFSEISGCFRTGIAMPDLKTTYRSGWGGRGGWVRPERPRLAIGTYGPGSSFGAACTKIPPRRVIIRPLRGLIVFFLVFLCYRTPYSPLVLISLGYFCVLESGPCRSQPLAGQGRFVVDIGPGASTLLNGLESKLLAQISVCFLWGPLGDHLRRGEGGESPRCPPCFLPKPCFLCSPAVPETN